MLRSFCYPLKKLASSFSSLAETNSMTASAEISLSISIYLYLSIYLSIYLSLSEIDKIRLLGFTTLHDSRRYAIPRCLDPSHPRQTQSYLIYPLGLWAALRGWLFVLANPGI